MKPRITRWGHLWCCYWLTGPAGFGDTPALAYSDWACRIAAPSRFEFTVERTTA